MRDRERACFLQVLRFKVNLCTIDMAVAPNLVPAVLLSQLAMCLKAQWRQTLWRCPLSKKATGFAR